MIAFNLLLVAALYSGAAHAISLSPRLDCSSLGTGATDTLPSHFTLVAHDSAKNASVPLFLHNTGAIPHQSWSVLVVGRSPLSWQDYKAHAMQTSQDMSFSNFSLNGGALNAFATNPNLAATAAIGNTKGDPSKFGQAGPWPTFATNGAVPAAQYCAVVSSSNRFPISRSMWLNALPSAERSGYRACD